MPPKIHSIEAHLNEQEIQIAVSLLDEDQRSHLRANKESLKEFLTLLNRLKMDGSQVLDRPSVIQTAFFLAAGGQE